jgi:hypothetical protein
MDFWPFSPEGWVAVGIAAAVVLAALLGLLV